MMMLMFFFSYGGDCLDELGDRERLHYPETGFIWGDIDEWVGRRIMVDWRRSAKEGRRLRNDSGISEKVYIYIYR